MRKKYFLGLSIFTVIVVLIADQLTKWLIVAQMTVGESFTVIPNALAITSHRNNGAAWGILSGHLPFFYIITVVILIALVYFYIKEAQEHLLMQFSISLLIAGALGNFIDRVLKGEVVDFIDTKIFGYDFPIFNIADSSLTIGVILLIIVLVFSTQREKG
ncbi:signal peptidase II [Staphylococcus hyicus]|uniref:Signal peptidase II n=2 Tax=Staphylococcus hyicus TaxID=1284 RepID=A0ACD5FML8_STAHY|nr:signal peptidase II [Staphylococcus hyicus]AJC96427.1 lipoprotein signal peptidase [Staphylococcus hyicus]MCE5153227.1 signal peptidase II [Staphylococcus hyicus]MCQ9290495.1 signal peptidase II [Staphylococcus hyicus]MCQ9301063.1 signal peptidase II [Staphylococcus hyicus]MCQ9305737.1 signal peptidase II [Staphylococcus hyicus]